MDSASNTDQSSAATNAGGDKVVRARTQIEFPYTDISQAEELARHLMDRGGGAAESDQLAAWMDQSAHGGTFRSRLSAARMFGFITVESGVVRITQDGRDVLDPDMAASVRVAAFLRIPLFNAMYEKNKGYALPPAAAIERQMVDLGVPMKQKERARQVFQKSAALAQFVDANSGRFTKPAVTDRPKEEGERDPGKNKGGSGGGDDGGDEGEPDKAKHHPFVAGLLSELPKGDGYGQWKIDDQAEWLRAAASIFKLLSKQQGRIEITVKDTKTPTGEGQSA